MSFAKKIQVQTPEDYDSLYRKVRDGRGLTFKDIMVISRALETYGYTAARDWVNKDFPPPGLPSNMVSVNDALVTRLKAGYQWAARNWHPETMVLLVAGPTWSGRYSRGDAQIIMGKELAPVTWAPAVMGRISLAHLYCIPCRMVGYETIFVDETPMRTGTHINAAVRFGGGYTIADENVPQIFAGSRLTGGHFINLTGMCAQHGDACATCGEKFPGVLSQREAIIAAFEERSCYDCAMGGLVKLPVPKPDRKALKAFRDRFMQMRNTGRRN